MELPLAKTFNFVGGQYSFLIITSLNLKEFGYTFVAQEYVSFSTKFNTILLKPACSNRGMPATVCNLWGIPANFEANIPTIPAFGVWVWTIKGFVFFRKKYNLSTANTSRSGVIFRVISRGNTATFSDSPYLSKRSLSEETAITL